MKKLMTVMAMLLCLSLVACGQSAQQPVEEANKESEPEVAAATVQPLPDTTMDNLTDAVLSVSLAEGDAYVDDKGQMQMALRCYDALSQS